jgi:hypothetical protein
VAQKKTTRKKQTAAGARARHPRERLQFKQLITANPNYFGNLLESPFKPVKEMATNAIYEELTCVGYNPSLKLLEGTVAIKLPGGYGGNLCLAGTFEHVRFFVDYGGGWQDVGVASFNIHDIPNVQDCADQPDKPLTYVVTLPIDPETDYCGNPVLPIVRAILSWQVLPPAGDPNWVPVWGNIVEQHIQIGPRPWYWWDLFKFADIDLAQIKLPPQFEEIKLQPIPLPDPPPLSLEEVATRYKKLSRRKEAEVEVEPHRFTLPHLKMLAPDVAIDQQSVSSLAAEVQALDIDWGSVIDAFNETNANVSYEEIECLGLDYNLERLVATFRVKLPYGYSGQLCEAGSTEYIAFWADWDDTCEWTYLGTVPINVHDFPTIPADGLSYSAVLPVSLDAYRRGCAEPKIARVRAVLSWSIPPSTTDPDALTTWGNRLDAHVQIRPGDPVPPGIPYISILGGIGVADIDIFGTGMTLPGAMFALTGSSADPWDSTRQCPFGGLIVLQGPPVVGSRYRVRVRPTTTLAESIVTSPIRTVNFLGAGTWRFADPDGCFAYLDPLQNIDNLLGWWTPSGDELWEVRVEIVEPAPGTGILAVTPWHRVQLDNTRPERKPPLGPLSPPTIDISIDSGGDCKDFTVGTTITGHFVARDIHFGAYTLSTLPASMLPNSPSPSYGLVQTAPSPGNTWTLDTTGMDPCGYVILLQAWDRTIVNSSPGGHNYNSDDVGFCLRAFE